MQIPYREPISTHDNSDQRRGVRCAARRATYNEGSGKADCESADQQMHDKEIGATHTHNGGTAATHGRCERYCQRQVRSKKHDDKAKCTTTRWVMWVCESLPSCKRIKQEKQTSEVFRVKERMGRMVVLCVGEHRVDLLSYLLQFAAHADI